MRTVVVGGQGFLGSAVAAELLARGDEVVVFDHAADPRTCAEVFGDGSVDLVPGDMLDPRSLTAAFSGADEVYHLAGMLGTSELEDSILAAVHGNIIGAVNVFDAAIASGVPVVFYPAKPNVWLNTYTVTKFAAEQFGRLYSLNKWLNVPSLRYFNAYGPRQSITPVRKLIPTFAIQALSGAPLTVYGDGQQVVDLIFAPDLARITVDYARNEHQGEAIDCGRGVPLTVLEIASAVNEFFESPSGIVHLPMRRGETEGTQLVSDLSSLTKTLGPLQFADFASSLAETLHWYSMQPPRAVERAMSALVA
jgi:nucleoside-diphosphate-sugar epimerase